MNISFCPWVYFDDVYGPLRPENSLDRRADAHLPDAQCQEKTEQREQELWPIRRQGSCLLPSTATDQWERSQAPVHPPQSRQGWAKNDLGVTFRAPQVQKRTGISNPVHSSSIKKKILLAVCYRSCSSSIWVPLECLSHIVGSSVAYWRIRLQKNWALYFSLSSIYFLSYLQIFLCFWCFPLPYVDLICISWTSCFILLHTLFTKPLLLNTTY